MFVANEIFTQSYGALYKQTFFSAYNLIKIWYQHKINSLNPFIHLNWFERCRPLRCHIFISYKIKSIFTSVKAAPSLRFWPLMMKSKKNSKKRFFLSKAYVSMWVLSTYDKTKVPSPIRIEQKLQNVLCLRTFISVRYIKFIHAYVHRNTVFFLLFCIFFLLFRLLLFIFTAKTRFEKKTPLLYCIVVFDVHIFILFYFLVVIVFAIGKQTVTEDLQANENYKHIIRLNFMLNEYVIHL